MHFQSALPLRRPRSCSSALCIIRRRCVQVAVRPYLLYSSSSHEGTPSGRARLPTASPPPTTILGSVDMMLTAIGTAIQVLTDIPSGLAPGLDGMNTLSTAINVKIHQPS